MNPVFKNVIAVIVGVVVGMALNILVVNVGPSIIPVPEGVDFSTMESLVSTMHLMEPQNFIPPFIAHALQSLVGAGVAFVMAANSRVMLAYIVGTLSFAGGVYAATTLPAPMWFNVVDLVFAYFPMAWIATKIGAKLVSDSTPGSTSTAHDG